MNYELCIMNCELFSGANPTVMPQGISVRALRALYLIVFYLHHYHTKKGAELLPLL